jgi:hypothetical protein
LVWNCVEQLVLIVTLMSLPINMDLTLPLQKNGYRAGRGNSGRMVRLELLPSSLRQNQNDSDEVAAVIFETEIWRFGRLLPISSI